MYGLAIASVLVGKADRAMELFQGLVAASRPEGQGRPPGQQADVKVDPNILAWSHVYLGRIHDLQGDRDLAVAEYRDALAVDAAPGVGARRGAAWSRRRLSIAGRPASRQGKIRTLRFQPCDHGTIKLQSSS